MATEVRLPQWGMGMQEGTVVRWLKKVGDRVDVGDELVEIEAAKVTQAITSTVAGVLLQTLVAEGQTIPVRTAVALVGAPEEARTAPPPPAPAVASPPPTSADAAPRTGARVQITPLARRVAKELGVDVGLVQGSGPGGRIDEADVRAYAEGRRTPGAEAAPGAAAGEQRPTADTTQTAAPTDGEAMTGMRRTIARRMLDSLHMMAQLTLFTEIDVTELVDLRERLKRDFDVTYTDLIVQAAARALAKHPLMNASLDGERIQRHREIHIGVAVALPEGLIVPVIRNADRKSLREIAGEAKRLVERARNGQLTVEEATGSTFSITNLGAYGIDGFTPIINAPEAAILGVGRIVEKPAAYRGAVALRHMLTLSLTHDHRLVDGAPAAEFLQTLAEMLAMPYLMGGGETTAI